MTQYLYPQNLKATANLWLWGLRDFAILGIAALLSIVCMVQFGFFIPAAATTGLPWPLGSADTDIVSFTFLPSSVRYCIGCRKTPSEFDRIPHGFSR